VRKAYVDLPEGQIHYRVSGDDGSPTWLLLHRTAASSVMYEPLMQTSPDWRCVAPDTPGFGASFDPPGSPDIDAYANWIEEFVDALGIEDCWVFGHHTGANIAVELAHRLPNTINGLALMGLTYFSAAERAQFKPLFAEEYTPSADGSYLESNWQWVKQLAVTEAGNAVLHQEFLDTTRAYQGRVQAFSAVWDQDLPARLQALDLPLLLMCAEDEMLYQYLQRAAEALPAATVATIKEDGCFAPELAAPKLAGQLRNWVSG
jgi:pimeloyl-ACP methyl ester carboxylesterase